MAENLRIGTCSWNYRCWVGLVYSKEYRTAVEYLKEYSKNYNTVEVDSSFYRIPSSEEISEYNETVGPDFRFTFKVPQSLTLTHLRNKAPDGSLQTNETFLSSELYRIFIQRLSPIAPKITAALLQFEYLRREKMSSLDKFLRVLEGFLSEIPRTVPIAIEPRNGNYLCNDYFAFIKENGLIHVFSEKQYMPSITTLYQKYGFLITSESVIRLLGGDRSEIEEKTGEQWDKIVEKRDKKAIVEMIREMLKRGIKVTVNVNNHYEGCAPLSIKSLLEEIG